MNRINYNGSDTEECVSAFRRLSENLRDDQELAKRLAASEAEISERLYETEKLTGRLACAADETAAFLEKLSEEYDSAEERVKALVRQSVFQHSGNIVVEKTRTPVRSELISGRAVKHDINLVSRVVKERAGEMI